MRASISIPSKLGAPIPSPPVQTTQDPQRFSLKDALYEVGSADHPKRQYPSVPEIGEVAPR